MGSESIVVVGAGSIGCFVGGRLLAAGQEVMFIGRPRVADACTTHGMTLTEMGKAPQRVEPERVRFATQMDAAGDADIVLFCVKSGATESAARELGPFLRSGARIASLQNGLSNADEIRRVIPAHEVVPTVVEFNVVSKGDGQFHCGMSGAIRLENHDPSLTAALQASDLGVSVERDLRPHQWTKLVVNLNNAISALSGQPTAELLSRPEFRRILADVIDEALSVLRAASIRPARLRGVPLGFMPRVLRLPTFLVRLVTSRQLAVDPEARSSMWEDLEKRRTTEVGYLNGEIVRLADSAGVSAPLNARIVELIRDAEVRQKGPPNLSAEALRSAFAGG